jgi:hypothetical protein
VSSTARPYACDLRHKNTWMIPRFTFITVEMLSFWGDCSMSESCLRESGDYYRVNKERIDYEVKNYTKKNKNYDNLNEFSKIFNCKNEGENLFSKKVIESKEQIFHTNFDKKPQEVMESIQSLIENDSELKILCKK